MRWFDSKSIIDEMWIGLCIVAVVVALALTKNTNAGFYTVGGTAIGALGVYLGGKPAKKNGGTDETTDETVKPAAGGVVINPSK